MRLRVLNTIPNTCRCATVQGSPRRCLSVRGGGSWEPAAAVLPGTTASFADRPPEDSVPLRRYGVDVAVLHRQARKQYGGGAPLIPSPGISASSSDTFMAEEVTQNLQGGRSMKPISHLGALEVSHQCLELNPDFWVICSIAS